MITFKLNSNLSPNNNLLKFSLKAAFSKGMQAFFTLFLFSLSIFSTKTFGQPCSDPSRCVSKDLEIVDAFIEGTDKCLSCTPGQTVERTLYVTIINKTGSVRPSFAAFATLSGGTFTPTGGSSTGSSVFFCGGDIPKKQGDVNGTLTLATGKISFKCGDVLTLNNVYEAWTDASGNTADRCADFKAATTCSDIAPKCGTAASITIRTPLSVAATDSTRPCQGTNTGSLTFKATGGTSPYSYTLSGGTLGSSVTNSTGVFTGLGAGTYSISVTDNTSPTKCTATNTVTLTAIPKPAKPTLQVTQPTCDVATGCIKVTAPTGTGYSYSLNGGTYQTSAEFCGLATGTYCISAKKDDCISDTACAKVNSQPTKPAKPTLQVTQPTCTQAGCIKVTAPTGTGYSYSINGGTYQTSAEFCGLAAGTYCISAKLGDCISDTACAKINSAPTKPAKPTLQVTQPTCDVSTGCIKVTAPTGTGYSYSLNGGTYQTSAEFCGLAAGTYCISAKLGDCISDTACAKINSAPTKPAKPTLQVTQPTCDVSTGCIKVTAPTGTGYSYSLNGGTYQTSPEFCGLAAGTYCIKAKVGDCISDTACATINSAPTKPAKPTLQVTQPTCSVTTGCIKVTAPTGTGYSYSINGGTYQTSAEFCGLAPGTYCIKAKIGDCVSDTACAKLVAATNCQLAGCTPGFWKNTRTRWDSKYDAVSKCIAAATASTTDNGTINDLFRVTFGLTSQQMINAGLNPNLTLLQALQSGGGGCFKLLRHATAALLNSCALQPTKFSYKYTTAQVLQMTHDAIASKTCEPTASKFAAANETGTCPLSSDGNADRTITSAKPGDASDDVDAVEEVSTLSVSTNPNPYSTSIRFVIKSPVSGAASLDLYNVMGQRLQNVFKGHIDAGRSKTVDFNVPPSIRTNLIYKLNVGGRFASGRVLKQ